MSDFGLFLLLFATLCLIVALIRFFAWLTDIVESGGFVAAFRRTADRYVVVNHKPIMSTTTSTKQQEQSDPVYIPVPHTDMPSSGIPDIEAKPIISRNITDSDLVVLLAVVRTPDGKYRYSANDIYGLVKGDRNSVLARIKEIRSVPPPAEYRPIDENKQPVLN